MTATRNALIFAALVVPIVSVPVLAADRSDAHALALSHRYGAYTQKGNLAAGQTVVIETPEGAVTCMGGVNREFTGKSGPQGDVKHGGRVRSCQFNGGTPTPAVAVPSATSQTVVVLTLAPIIEPCGKTKAENRAAAKVYHQERVAEHRAIARAEAASGPTSLRN